MEKGYQMKNENGSTAGRAAVALEVIEGRPMAVRDGVPVPLVSYCGHCRHGKWEHWIDRFMQSGVGAYHFYLGRPTGRIGSTRFWLDDGDYGRPAPDDKVKPPFQTVDESANYILGRNPDALLFVRIVNNLPPPPWAEKNPDDVQRDSEGEAAIRGGAFIEGSYASDKFVGDMCTYLRRVVAYCEAQPWGERVAGYLIIPIGEGLTLLSLAGGFYERSGAMQRAWRDFLRRTYGTDEALRRAWGRQDVSLDEVEVPYDRELREKADRLPYWPSAAEMRVERDYALLQREVFARYFNAIFDALREATAERPVLLGIDALKQPLLGWQHNEFFYGTGDGARELSMYLSTGSIGVGPLLEHPALHCLYTPACYHGRAMGYGYAGEGQSDSLNLLGKFLYVENDTRTFLSRETPDGRPTMGAFMTLQEVRAGLLRNSAEMLSHGHQHCYVDVGTGDFDDDGIQEQVRADGALLRAGMARPRPETEHAIAFVIDDMSPLYTNFTKGFQNLAVLRQRVDALAFCGIPYRTYLLSDLEKDSFPPYRCYLFPNLFKVDEGVLALLRRKVLRDGRIAVFGPGTGITDGEHVTAAPAEALLGMPMKLYGADGNERSQANCSRRVRLLDAPALGLRAAGLPSAYGDSLRYGPVLVPDPHRLAAAGVKVLGNATFTWHVNAPGLVLKDFGRGGAGSGAAGARGEGDYAVAFSGAVPIPAAVLRGLAAYGGCNVWCDADVVISADEGMLSLHSAARGPYELNLPRTVKRITDALTGATAAADTKRFEVELDAPQTRVYWLED